MEAECSEGESLEINVYFPYSNVFQLYENRMKLVTSPDSTFSCKGRDFSVKVGLAYLSEIVLYKPWKPEFHVPALYPIGKAPVLSINVDVSLNESMVTCKFADSLHDAVNLLPSTDTNPWTALIRKTFASQSTSTTTPCH